MNEWEVIGVVITLVTFLLLVYKPLLDVNKTLTLNTQAIQYQSELIKCNETRNEREHEKLWTELGNHDVRITVMEKIVL